MTIRNNINLAAYDFINDNLTFVVDNYGDTFIQKLWDADVLIDDKVFVEFGYDDFENESLLYITAPSEFFQTMICKGRPYVDKEIEEWLDVVAVILEQLPQTFIQISHKFKES